MSHYELADSYWCCSKAGIVTIEPDLERASEWMFTVDGRMVGHGYYSAEELADHVARHQTGEAWWDEQSRHVRVPSHISEWTVGRPADRG